MAKESRPYVIVSRLTSPDPKDSNGTAVRDVEPPHQRVDHHRLVSNPPRIMYFVYKEARKKKRWRNSSENSFT